MDLGFCGEQQFRTNQKTFWDLQAPSGAFIGIDEHAMSYNLCRTPRLTPISLQVTCILVCCKWKHRSFGQQTRPWSRPLIIRKRLSAVQVACVVSLLFITSDVCLWGFGGVSKLTLDAEISCRDLMAAVCFQVRWRRGSRFKTRLGFWEFAFHMRLKQGFKMKPQKQCWYRGQQQTTLDLLNTA